MRDRDAAEHDLVARAEGVDVVAGADPDVAEGQRRLGGEAPLGGGDIVGRGELDVAGIARDDAAPACRPIRRRAASSVKIRPAARRLLVRGEDGGEAEALRRLGRVEAFARDGRGDHAVGVDRFSVLGTGRAGTTASASSSAADHAADQVGRDERPCRVMDQHRSGISRRKRLETRAEPIPAAFRRR